MAANPRHTFPKSARLTSKMEFDRVFREGLRASDGLLTLLVASSPIQGARLGISVSRRFGNAVRRNRAKRLIREVFRRVRHNWPPRTDWVAIPRPGAADLTLDAVKNSLDRLSDQLGRRLLQHDPGVSSAVRPRGPAKPS